jgi:hypothetical protein
LLWYIANGKIFCFLKEGEYEVKKKSVGLIILTEIESLGGWVAILQRRGEFNHEKMAPESFPGACQVTAHGKCDNGESEDRALWREIREELGLQFEASLYYYMKGGGGVLFKILTEKETDKEKVMTFGVVIPAKLIGNMRLNASSGGLKIVKKQEVLAGHIVELIKTDREHGIPNMAITAMFPDERDAVVKAFEKLA